MKISIRTIHYTPSEQTEKRAEAKSDLIGYATLRFDDNYVLDKVQIRERRDNNELFVALPTIPDKEGKPKEFFHPITPETRTALNKAVLGQFNDENVKQGDYYAYDLGEKVTFKPTAKADNFFDFTKENVVGIGSVRFGEWVCENISVKRKVERDADGNSIKGKYTDELYVDTPKYPKKKDGKITEYQQMFYPVTEEAAAEFKKVCIDALEEFKKEKAKNADWGIGVHEERTNVQSVEKDNVQDASDDYSDIDVSEFEDLVLPASNGRSR